MFAHIQPKKSYNEPNFVDRVQAIHRMMKFYELTAAIKHQR
jgi:hypothetical protein